MKPKQSVALWAALFAPACAVAPACADGDATSLLQKPVRQSPPLQVQKRGGVHLLETAQAIVSKVNAGDDPSGCGLASDAARAAVEEALPAIIQQLTHLSNQILPKPLSAKSMQETIQAVVVWPVTQPEQQSKRHSQQLSNNSHTFPIKSR